MLKRKLLLMMIAAWMMTACASGAQPTPEPNLLAPASLTTACPAALPQPVSGQRSELVKNHAAVARIYHKCRQLFLGLIGWTEVVADD